MDSTSDPLEEARSTPIEGYLRELATERKLPDLAIAMCVMRYDEAGPALRSILERAADGEELSEDDASLLFRGLHIMGARRDQQGFKPLLRFLRRPNDELESLLGDAITQGLSRIAVGVFDGNADALFDAIVDLGLDEFVREALLGAATFLAWEGRIEPERMTRFLERFHAERLAEDEDYAWIGWVEAIGLLGLRSLAPLVEQAWGEGRLPEGIMDPKHFREDLAAAEAAPDDVGRFEEANLGYFADAIEALEWTRREPEEEAQEGDDVWSPSPETFSQPFINPMRHVGRNDPCPCGSGKKAKRCCLATG
jgi:hypothetical protein